MSQSRLHGRDRLRLFGWQLDRPHPCSGLLERLLPDPFHSTSSRVSTFDFGSAGLIPGWAHPETELWACARDHARSQAAGASLRKTFSPVHRVVPTTQKAAAVS